MPAKPQWENIGIDEALASPATLEARAYLHHAIARLQELSDNDHKRLVYLEQRSIDNQEANEDLFHTANNALFIISVNLELVRRHLFLSDECHHATVRKWLGLLQQKTKEIATLNRKFLSAGVSEGEGPLYLIHSYISFRAVIQRAVDVYEDVAREKDIRISWQLPDFAAIAIWSDGIALGVVLDNLLSNAIKFSSPGTTVDVSMRHEGDELICSVRDQGPGLSEADRARLFERGVPLRPKPTGGESSSGYGLAVALGVVESLGGRLWCESIEGQGSSFMVSLPTAVPPQHEHDASPDLS
ncbi:MAG TPA: HAMP domain-containing sensor histidine kinase [Thermoanaerobaculia bacterium]|nr:HAMP domain-containing sensor histidine kinase [Thermoanaerobaculia bacterium]